MRNQHIHQEEFDNFGLLTKIKDKIFNRKSEYRTPEQVLKLNPLGIQKLPEDIEPAKLMPLQDKRKQEDVVYLRPKSVEQIQVKESPKAAIQFRKGSPAVATTGQERNADQKTNSSTDQYGQTGLGSALLIWGGALTLSLVTAIGIIYYSNHQKKQP